MELSGRILLTPKYIAKGFFKCLQLLYVRHPQKDFSHQKKHRLCKAHLNFSSLSAVRLKLAYLLLIVGLLYICLPSEEKHFQRLFLSLKNVSHQQRILRIKSHKINIFHLSHRNRWKSHKNGSKSHQNRLPQSHLYPPRQSFPLSDNDNYWWQWYYWWQW